MRTWSYTSDLVLVLNHTFTRPFASWFLNGFYFPSSLWSSQQDRTPSLSSPTFQIIILLFPQPSFLLWLLLRRKCQSLVFFFFLLQPNCFSDVLLFLSYGVLASCLFLCHNPRHLAPGCAVSEMKKRSSLNNRQAWRGGASARCSSLFLPAPPSFSSFSPISHSELPVYCDGAL